MMSMYALEWLDILISVTLNSKKNNLSCLSFHDAELFKKRALIEKEEIRMMLMRQIFSVNDERMLEVLIQQYQSSLIRLLDTIEDNKSYLYSITYLHSLTEELITILEELLSFIELHFIKYYNVDQLVPNTYLQISQKEWKSDLKKVERYLKDLNNTQDALLIKVLRSYLNALYLSYREMIYVKDLFTHILKALNSASISNGLFTPLEEALIYLNFNDAFFVAELIQKMDREINFQQNKELTKNALSLHQQKIEGLSVKPGAKYQVDLPSVAHSLISWITFQLSKLNHEPPTNNISFMEKQQSKINNKVNLSISVAMLGLFIRLLTEEEIIATKNQAELIRFFASNFATPKQDMISPESLYGSYFKPQPGTIKMMNECLSRMHYLLNKKF